MKKQDLSSLIADLVAIVDPGSFTLYNYRGISPHWNWQACCLVRGRNGHQYAASPEVAVHGLITRVSKAAKAIK